MSKKWTQAFVDELTLLSHKYEIVIGQYPDNIASPATLKPMGGYAQGFGRYMICGEDGHWYLEWHNSYWSVVEDYIAWARALRSEQGGKLPEGHETFESTEELRAAYPDAKLLIDIAEIQMAQSLDDSGRAHSFISHDRQHWWGVLVTPTVEETQ